MFDMPYTAKMQYLLILIGVFYAFTFIFCIFLGWKLCERYYAIIDALAIKKSGFSVRIGYGTMTI